MNDVLKRQGANLPHWSRKRGTYFVTFRLADALPGHVIASLRAEISEQLKLTEARLGRKLSALEATKLRQKLGGNAEKYLDRGIGACWLKDPTAAECVQEALHFDHETRYRLFAWAVMPNHVHAVLKTKPDEELSKILHTWKSITSKRVNAIVGRQGKLWQPESFDHLIRTSERLEQTCQYVVDNPTKAGLIDWPWVGRLL